MTDLQKFLSELLGAKSRPLPSPWTPRFAAPRPRRTCPYITARFLEPVFYIQPRRLIDQVDHLKAETNAKWSEN